MPNEVVTIVLNHLYKDVPHDLIRALSVCRTWLELGTQTIYKDVVLVSSDQMLKLAHADKTSFRSTRSLTIKVPPMEKDSSIAEDNPWDHDWTGEANRATKRLHNSLWVVVALLPAFTSLESFSFHISTQSWHDHPEGFFVDCYVLNEIVWVLPATVRHLEIDTKASDRVKDGQQHLCSTLASRLQGLETLRLHVGNLCSDLFNASSTLRSVVINLMNCAGITEAQDCAHSIAWNPQEFNAWPKRQDIGRATRRDLVAAASFMVGQLPALETFKILDSNKSRYSFDLEVDAIFVRDVIQKQTTVIPTKAVFEFRESTCLHNVRLLRSSDSHAQSEDIVGVLGNIEEVLEGPLWHSTDLGARSPMQVKESHQGKTRQWQSYDNFSKREELSNNRIQCKLWDEEGSAGRRLVDVCIKDGLEYDEWFSLPQWRSQEQLDREAEEFQKECEEERREDEAEARYQWSLENPYEGPSVAERMREGLGEDEARREVAIARRAWNCYWYKQDTGEEY
jgi:hypothetical protein